MWIGDLDPWMDENYVLSMFAHVGEAASSKIIRDKQTGVPAGYGFVYFTSPTAAAKALELLRGQLMPGTTMKTFKLNWANQLSGQK